MKINYKKYPVLKNIKDGVIEGTTSISFNSEKDSEEFDIMVKHIKTVFKKASPFCLEKVYHLSNNFIKEYNKPENLKFTESVVEKIHKESLKDVSFYATFITGDDVFWIFYDTKMENPFVFFYFDREGSLISFYDSYFMWNYNAHQEKFKYGKIDNYSLNQKQHKLKNKKLIEEIMNMPGMDEYPEGTTYDDLVNDYGFHFNENASSFKIKPDGFEEISEEKCLEMMGTNIHNSIGHTMGFMVFILSCEISDEIYESTTLKGKSKKKIDNQTCSNETPIKITYLDKSWFTNIIRISPFDVSGHWREQPYKNEKKELCYKRIWIDGYQKSGYNRKAKKHRL